MIKARPQIALEYNKEGYSGEKEHIPNPEISGSDLGSWPFGRTYTGGGGLKINVY